MRKPFIFGKAVVGDWIGRMSGGVGLILGFAAKFWKNDRVPDAWLWSACALCLLFAVYRAWAREHERAEKAAPSVDGILYRENVKLRIRVEELERQAEPRSVKDRNAGARTLAAGLEKLRESFRVASWSPGDISKPFTIFIISLGADGETLRYREDLQGMFVAGGFEVTCATWPPSSGFDEFTGAVTVLTEKPGNVVRPFVIDALRVAGVEIREASCPAWPRGATAYGIEDAAVRLIVGSR